MGILQQLLLIMEPKCSLQQLYLCYGFPHSFVGTFPFWVVIGGQPKLHLDREAGGELRILPLKLPKSKACRRRRQSASRQKSLRKLFCSNSNVFVTKLRMSKRLSTDYKSRKKKIMLRTNMPTGDGAPGMVPLNAEAVCRMGLMDPREEGT